MESESFNSRENRILVGLIYDFFKLKDVMRESDFKGMKTVAEVQAKR